SVWVGGREYGLATAEEAEPVAGDPAKWRALAARRRDEIRALEAEVAALREELAQAKEEPAKTGLATFLRRVI
ncbi:hypothetical protein, partial [Nonomuraea dietziae]